MRNTPFTAAATALLSELLHPEELGHAVTQEVRTRAREALALFGEPSTCDAVHTAHQRPTITLYISGPMSGLPANNYPAFHAAALQLRAAGYTVINPAENGLPDRTTWAEHMRVDIQAMLATPGTGMAMLPNWAHSEGAKLEHHIAIKLGMPCLPYWMWADLAKAFRAGGAA